MRQDQSKSNGVNESAAKWTYCNCCIAFQDVLKIFFFLVGVCVTLNGKQYNSKHIMNCLSYEKRTQTQQGQKWCTVQWPGHTTLSLKSCGCVVVYFLQHCTSPKVYADIQHLVNQVCGQQTSFCGHFTAVSHEVTRAIGPLCHRTAGQSQTQ